MHHVDFGLLVLRAALGLMLMAHGANKVKGGLIGAAVGGILGGVIGNNVDVQKKTIPY